jgi:hypothetical protein
MDHGKGFDELFIPAGLPFPDAVSYGWKGSGPSEKCGENLELLFNFVYVSRFIRRRGGARRKG